MIKSIFKKVLLICCFGILPFLLNANPDNIATSAKVSVSNSLDAAHDGANINDGVIMYDGAGEWACKGYVTSWGVMYMPWVQLEWEKEVDINRVVLYDRVTMEEHISGGTLYFSDGSELSVTTIPNDGSPKSVTFPSKKVKWIKFSATDGRGKNIGLSEIEVFPAYSDATDYVNWVDPYIETTRGRWFFCTPAARPFGMVAAHAYTSNKNQGGGGYNYNFLDIRGFTQVNAWMMSGLNIMPITGDVDPMLGEQGWKSPFKHESEIMQVGYHRLFLDKYKTWVEYTATERATFYRLNYTQTRDAKLLVDIGSVLGNCDMNKGVITQVDEHRISGHFVATDRFWEGPDSVALFFVLDCDKPIKSIDGWNEKGVVKGVASMSGDNSGMILNFDLGNTSELKIKMALSYTSIENAAKNMEAELNHWDFDKVKNDTRDIWNRALGKIDVTGGTEAQKIKFYTDLWHVVLGRHRINDVNGFYPDYASANYVGKSTSDKMKVRQIPLDVDGNPKFNMYGFDALWLTQWNLNILWGLAWPEILDDFSACLIEYANNGGLLPRGACAGGYSFIMTGCPSSNMLVSTYMKGLMKKVDPEQAYKIIKRNHLVGGMMSYEDDSELKFYIKNGWCPGNAGKTLEWAFQDWGLSQMAKKMGKDRDAREFARRAHAWKPLFNNEKGLIFPKDKDGNWLHLEPLNGRGWIESNSWQGTWSLSHDIPELIKLMGSSDVFCEKLNYAFEQAQDQDFVFEYSGGYVSYANQPGCSNAHLFNYAGKPWLTQYWVRRVNSEAYGGITPDKGYGGHDEDQGQMGGVSALMSMGLFSVMGTQTITPFYEITSPVFDEITIKLNPKYYSGKEFKIKVHNNSAHNYYIQKATLNGEEWNSLQFKHSVFEKGGALELWLDNKPNKNWGEIKYYNN